MYGAGWVFNVFFGVALLCSGIRCAKIDDIIGVCYTGSPNQARREAGSNAGVPKPESKFDPTSDEYILTSI